MAAAGFLPQNFFAQNYPQIPSTKAILPPQRPGEGPTLVNKKQALRIIKMRQKKAERLRKLGLNQSNGTTTLAFGGYSRTFAPVRSVSTTKNQNLTYYRNVNLVRKSQSRGKECRTDVFYPKPTRMKIILLQNDSNKIQN